jgi:soluble lytic murein transglycosylase-like protein
MRKFNGIWIMTVIFLAILAVSFVMLRDTNVKLTEKTEQYIEEYEKSMGFMIEIEEYKLKNEALLEELDETFREFENIRLEMKSIENQLSEYKEEILKAEYMVLWKRNVPLDDEYQMYLYEKCIEYGLDYDLAIAKISLESNFNVAARGYNKRDNGSIDSTDYGLMQVNSKNLKWVNELAGEELDVINDVYDNIDAGLLIFKHYYNYWELKGYIGYELNVRALNSYNRGLKGYYDYMAEEGNSWDTWRYAKLVLDRMGR